MTRMMMLGNCKRSPRHGIVDIFEREIGELMPRNFAYRAMASEDLILRLGIDKELLNHDGCVNTVSFNLDGSLLLSGSDDRMILLWDWDSGQVKLSFESGHLNNVFHALFMPYTNDRAIVTCAADGEVRHAQLLEGGKPLTELLAQHNGQVHKLAIHPGSPDIFYSAGEDGIVRHFDLRAKHSKELIRCRSFQSRSSYMLSVNLNAIAIDPRNSNLIAVAGTDEFVRVYDIRSCKSNGLADCTYPANYFCPPHMIGHSEFGITGLAFSDTSELLASYSEEFIYLFTDDLGLGLDPLHPSPETSSPDGGYTLTANATSKLDSNGNPLPRVYKGHRNMDTVKSVSFLGPNSEYVASGSDCGRVFIWRKKDGELLRAMEGDEHIVNCVESHPRATVIASSGIDNDIKIWTPNATERAQPLDIEQLLRENWSGFLSDYDNSILDDYDSRSDSSSGSDGAGLVVVFDDDEEDDDDDNDSQVDMDDRDDYYAESD